MPPSEARQRQKGEQEVMSGSKSQSVSVCELVCGSSTLRDASCPSCLSHVHWDAVNKGLKKTLFSESIDVFCLINHAGLPLPSWGRKIKALKTGIIKAF